MGPTDLSKETINPPEGKKDNRPPVEPPRPEYGLRVVYGACWYLPVKVGRYLLSLLVDTGACTSILSTTAYYSMEESERPTLMAGLYPLYGADGSRLVVHGEVELALWIDGEIFDSTMLVVEIAETQGVLGADFLEKHACRLDLSMGYLVTPHYSHELVRVASSDGTVLKTDGTSHIRAGEEATVVMGPSLQIQEGEVINWSLLEYVGAMMGLVSGTDRVQPGARGPQVSISNWGGEDITLLPGTMLGTASRSNEVGSVAGVIGLVTEAGVDQLPEYLEPLYQETTREEAARPEAVKALLMKHQKVFAQPGKPLGQTDVVVHEIDVEGAKPIKQAPRRMAFSQYEVADKEIKKMIEDGIIEPAGGPWSSPAVLVRKKCGDIRFCIDYRLLNSVTKKDSFPSPNLSECLDALEGCDVFAVMDLKTGYWQVKMKEQDKEKTAFSCRHQFFQFKVMPMGCCGASSTFNRLMGKVLGDLLWHECINYLDDVIVFGKGPEQLWERLDHVLGRLGNAGLTLKPSKCYLFRRSVSFLGHTVSKEGVSCDEDKIAAVKTWPRPGGQTEIRSFLGFCSFYRRFIEGFSEIAVPLIELTKKNQPYVWTKECESSFQLMKEKLTSAPVLGHPRNTMDPEEPFILDSDASGHSIGAVLSQRQDGDERVIYYGSKILSPAQRAWCVTYRELFAIVHFVQKFKHFLLGRRFLIRCDHASLRWLLNFKQTDGMICRWITKLGAYDFTVLHRPGAKHVPADALSRIPPRRCCKRMDCAGCSAAGKTGSNSKEPEPTARAGELVDVKPELLEGEAQERNRRWVGPIQAGEGAAPSDNDANWLDVTSIEELRVNQEKDPEIGLVRGWVEENRPKPSTEELLTLSQEVRAICAKWESLVLKDGVLHVLSGLEGKDRMVLPFETRKKVFEALHQGKLAAHLGVNKCLAAVKRRYYWPRCKEDVRLWVRECEVCQQVKPGPRYSALLDQRPVGAPFDRIAIDALGELPETSAGNKYILVVADYFTKWTQAFAVKDIMAQTCADVLVNEFFTLWGAPSYLHSDQGRNFESNLFAEVCNILGVKKTRTTSYRPCSDGLVERMNRTLLAMLKSTVESDYEWDQALPFVMSAYRTSVHESTGMTPFRLVMGREMTLPIDLIVGEIPAEGGPYRCMSEYVLWLQEAWREGHRVAQRTSKVAARRQKNNYDAARRPYKYRVGDFVWRYYPPAAKAKLGRGWTGPYRIKEVVGANGCVIQKSPGSNELRVHCDSLKPHHGRIPQAWDIVEEPVAEEEESGTEDEETDPGGSEAILSPDEAGDDSDEEPLRPRARKPPLRYVEEY